MEAEEAASETVVTTDSEGVGRTSWTPTTGKRTKVDAMHTDDGDA